MESIKHISEITKMRYSLELTIWNPDGSCEEESSTSISAQEYEELFARFVLKQENKKNGRTISQVANQ